MLLVKMKLSIGQVSEVKACVKGKKTRSQNILSFLVFQIFRLDLQNLFFQFQSWPQSYQNLGPL